MLDTTQHPRKTLASELAATAVEAVLPRYRSYVPRAPGQWPRRSLASGPGRVRRTSRCTSIVVLVQTGHGGVQLHRNHRQEFGPVKVLGPVLVDGSEVTRSVVKVVSRVLEGCF